MENNFEKQVRQKMEKMQIQPSGDVWDKVNANIGHKKPSRRLAIIWLLLLAILLVGGYVTYQVIQPRKLANIEKSVPAEHAAGEGAATKKVPGISKQPEKVKTGIGEIIIPESAGERKKSNKIEKATEAQKPAQAVVVPKEKGRYDQISLKEQVLIKKEYSPKNSRDNSKRNIPLKAKNAHVEKVAHSLPSITELSFQSVLQNVTFSDYYTFNDTTPSRYNHIITPAGFDSIWNDLRSGKDSLPLNAISGKPTRKPLSGKWEMGILLAAGISHIGEKFLGSSPAYADYLQNNATGPSPNYSSVTYNEPFKNDLGFTIGVNAKKNISRNTYVLVGINYRKNSISQLVGQRNDSLNRYSAYNPSSKYVNDFHFLEIPMVLGFTTASNFPLQVTAGVAFSRLIATNALQFDPTVSATDPGLKAFFKDNSFFNKTQASVIAGVSYEIKSDAKMEISVGPFINYSISSLANSGTYNKQKMIYYGIQTKFSFTKNDVQRSY